MHLKIGTRGSPLALAQTNIFVEELVKVFKFTHEVVIIKTTGDKILDKPLYDVGGKALFVKELEEALLSKKIDIAIHSLKDVPGVINEKFTLGCYLERKHSFDCLVSYKARTIEGLKVGSKVGSASPRRAVFIEQIRPDLEILPIRGNINTRLNKLETEEYDAIILAEAGLRRLNLYNPQYCFQIPPSVMIPAVGQGVIASQILTDNIRLAEVLKLINHSSTESMVQIERQFLAELNANCRTPVAGFVYNQQNIIKGSFMIASDDMSKIKITDKTITMTAKNEGKNIARKLLENFSF